MLDVDVMRLAWGLGALLHGIPRSQVTDFLFVADFYIVNI